MKRRILLLVFIAVGLSLLYLKILDSYIEAGKVLGLDRIIYDFVLTIRTPLLTEVMIFITLLANWQTIIFSTILGTILLYMAKKERYLMTLLLTVSIGLMFTEAMKILVIRPRPPEVTALIAQNGYAFPSAHSYFAVAFYGLITYFWVKHFRNLRMKILMVILGAGCVLAIGVSRIYLGVHWASDVLGGLASSGTWLALMIASMEFKAGYLKKEYQEFDRKTVWRGFWGFTILWLVEVWLLFWVQK